MPQTKPGTATQTRKRFRRIQSMAGPIPCDARALAPGLVQARGWKARAFRATPTKDEAFQRQMRQTQRLDFGKVFLAFAVAGRQGLLKLVDDLGLEIGMGRRDATQPSAIPKPGSPSNGLRAAQPGSSAPPRALPPRRLALQKSSSRQLAVQACSCAS